MLSAVTQSNRASIDLAGFWQFRTDPENAGEAERWFEDPPGPWDTLYVPAAWNEQRAIYDDYMGPAWYRRHVTIPASWAGRRVRLVVQGALLTATVWCNGRRLAQHEGGFTPFEVDLTESLRYGEDNGIVVRVDNTVSLETIPQGTGQKRIHIDWYNWGGLYRPITLEAVNPVHLEDLTIRTLRASAVSAGVHIQGAISGDGDGGPVDVLLALVDPDGQTVAEGRLTGTDVDSSFSQAWEIATPKLWTPDAPTLYTLRVQVVQAGAIQDQVEFGCGLRTIEVNGGKLLLNGRPFFLKGISRVEDFPIQGRASWGPVLRRDHDLLKQCGANCYRSAGYFPSIPDVELGDQTGVCVVVDVPNYGKLLPETLEDPRLLAKVQTWAREAVAVYKNHPSVILWDLATEPRTITEGGRTYIQTLYDLLGELDPTRPVFYIWHCLLYKQDQAQDIVDMLCLWIGQRLHEDWDEGVALIDEQVEYMHQRYPDKPVILYFGDVAVPGMHSDPPRWYSEEFQARYFEWAWEYARTKPYVVGFWWWCLCDYRCRPSSSVNGLLRWGIYDRMRQPKLATRLIQRAYNARPSCAAEG